MFGVKAKPTRIYSYKCHKPHEGHKLASDQMWLAHRYKQSLIELERTRRGQVDDVIRRLHPDVLDLETAKIAAETAFEEAEVAIRKKNAQARKRSATGDDRKMLTALRRARAEAREAHKKARKFCFDDPAVREELDRIDAETLAEQKSRRAASNLYWGTYLFVEDALSDVRSGAPPKFRRWDGEGTIAVQLQGGLAWTDVLCGADQRVRVKIRPLHPDADPQSNRSRNEFVADVYVRSGTEDDRRTPKWVCVRTRFHRHPPAESRIKWVYLHRRLIGRREVWQVQFILERDSWAREDTATEGKCGLELGWRLVKDPTEPNRSGLRVAFVVGADGQEKSLILPHSLIQAWGKVDSLQSIRDKAFDAIRVKLTGWLKGKDVPEWHFERLKYLSQWRSPSRLAAVVWGWREYRFAGDEAIYKELEEWRKQDRHLYDWAESLRSKSINHRNLIYRRFAAWIGRNYQTVVIEKINWKKLQARPSSDAPDSLDATRANTKIGAVGTLKQYVMERAARVVEAPAEFTTKKCHKCGQIDEFDAGANLFNTCSACGELWDQDRNAAINLLSYEPEPEPAVVG